MKKNYAFLPLLICVIGFFSESVRAEEVWNFTRVTCVPELNYFDASVAQISSGSDEESKFVTKNQDVIRAKYNLRFEALNDIQKCELQNANLKIEVKYRKPKETGMCAENPDATLKLWIDNKLLVDLDSFNYCTADTIESVTGVSLKIKKNSNSIGLFFKRKNYLDAENSCVIWLNSKLQNITSNYCNNSHKNTSLPIRNENIVPIN